MLFIASAVFAQQPSQSGAAVAQKVGGAVVPAWTQIEKTVRSSWVERYPRETIVSIEKVGDPKFTDEPGKVETSTSSISSSVWDWSWNETSWTTTTKGREGAFLRQTIIATVERPNKTRAKFTVAAMYKLVGSQWTFVEIPVGKVEEIARAGAPGQPNDADASRIFTEAWAKTRPDFAVRGVKVAGKEFHQYGGRYWVTYNLVVDITGTDKAPASLKGKRATCEPSADSSVLKWDKDAAKWVADESAIGMINETSYCKEP
jgi:hypothetical protein